MARGAWWATVHGVGKSWTWLSDLAIATNGSMTKGTQHSVCHIVSSIVIFTGCCVIISMSLNAAEGLPLTLLPSPPPCFLQTAPHRLRSTSPALAGSPTAPATPPRAPRWTSAAAADPGLHPWLSGGSRPQIPPPNSLGTTWLPAASRCY